MSVSEVFKEELLKWSQRASEKISRQVQSQIEAKLLCNEVKLSSEMLIGFSFEQSWEKADSKYYVMLDDLLNLREIKGLARQSYLRFNAEHYAFEAALVYAVIRLSDNEASGDSKKILQDIFGVFDRKDLIETGIGSIIDFTGELAKFISRRYGKRKPLTEQQKDEFYEITLEIQKLFHNIRFAGLEDIGDRKDISFKDNSLQRTIINIEQSMKVVHSD